MSTVLFTSDLHIGHPKVADLRGFKDIDAHDIAIASRWCDNVGERDRVYVLGDVTGDSRTLDRALDLLADLPGEKHLIAGNHDSVHPMNRNAHKRLDEYLDVFTSVASTGLVKVGDTRVLLSHFPYTRDRGETRYRQWRLPNLGEWLLHGHTHGTERVSLNFRAEQTGADLANYAVTYRHTLEREIHVGADAWNLTPVGIDTIADLIKEHTS